MTRSKEKSQLRLIAELPVARFYDEMMAISLIMKFPKLLIFPALFISSVAIGQQKEVIDLVLVAGQSNAVGADTQPSELPADPTDKNVLFWWRTGDPPPDAHDSTSGGKKWTYLQPQPVGNPMKKGTMPRQYGNFAAKDGGFGPEIGFARHLLKTDPNRKLAIVKAAFSGTGIRKDWDPEDKTGDSGVCYRALISETNAALKAAKAEEKALKIRALIWVQGESDANLNDVDHYEKALTEMIAALRRDLYAPDMMALVAVNTKFGYGEKKLMPKIVDAQKAVAAADENSIYVDTSSATTANPAHYDTKGTLNVGQWFGEAFLKAESENKKGDQ